VSAAGGFRALAAALTATAVLHAAAPPAVHAQSTPGERLPVHEITLANGMRFLILPRPSAPTVSFVVEFGVGSVNEHLGITGIAHLLEHLLFKGTTTIGTRDLAAERRLFALMDAAHDTLLGVRGRIRPDSAELARLRSRIRALEDSARTFVVSNEFDRILSASGAQGLNATTTAESTYYFVELPSNRAELWFAMEADRMRNPVFREFYTERDVVAEERRMRVETSPGGLLYEAHLAAAYTMHPYGVPVIGYMSDIQTLSRRTVEAYYRRYYAPANAVVAIVGDVDVERTARWARSYFEQIPRGATPPPVLAREPLQKGERRVEVVFDAEPQLRIGWHVPDVFDDDAPAVAVLSTLLTGGRTSRLYHRLVEEDRVAASVFSSTGPGSRYPQLFQIDATPVAPHTTTEVEDAVYQALAELTAEGPSEAEIERVRNRIAAASVRRLQSNLGLAFQLAESTTLYGDWRATFRLSSRLRAVTPADVERVLRRYFIRENRTVAVLTRGDPEGHR